jgi:single-strand DNA-binding protein
MNKVILLGRLGQDPESRHVNSGEMVCSFSIATSDSWKDKDNQKQEKTEWHRIVCWRKTAELASKYLTKGRQVMIEGKLKTRNYDKDGTKVYVTEIIANNLVFVGEKTSSSEQPQESSNSNWEPQYACKGESSSQDTSSFTSDDIPF